jgi:hypothetical protein
MDFYIHFKNHQYDAAERQEKARREHEVNEARRREQVRRHKD